MATCGQQRPYAQEPLISLGLASRPAYALGLKGSGKLETKALLFLLGWAWILAAEVQPRPELEMFKATLQRGQELQAAGHPLAAQAQFIATLRVARELDPAHQALALAWLGSASVEAGRFAEGEQYLLQCLALREQLWGPANQRDSNHAKLLSSLGAIDHRFGRYEDSERRLSEALTIWRSINETSDVDYGICLNNLAMLRYSQRRFMEAADHLREAIKAWQHTMPPSDRRLAQGVANLAGVLSRLNLHEEADACSSRALAMYEDGRNRDSAIIVRLMMIRAGVLRNAKRGREAKRLEQRARELTGEMGIEHVVDISAFGSQTQ
jgi:tetratricopeptide (TPR) repeat protein